MSDMVECRKCQAKYIPSFVRDYYGGENGQGGLCESCFMREALTKPNPITLENQSHITNVCQPGQGKKTCRYLVMHPPNIFSCAKGSDLQSNIDERVNGMRAQGDNCSGPPDFQ